MLTLAMVLVYRSYVEGLSLDSKNRRKSKAQNEER